MTFTEDWFCTESCDVLASLVKRVSNVDGLVVEIGSWEGRSTIALANAAYPRRVHACDTWQGSPGEVSADLAAGRDVHATWRRNVTEQTRRNVAEHRMGWREYVPTIDEPVALAFIDAEHTYREVFDNVTALLPLIAEGGILCGDDAHHPPIVQALSELFNPEDVCVSATVWFWVKPYTNPTLQQRYERYVMTPSDINEHLPVLATMAAKANHIVELGARSGVSTTAWLHGLQAGGRLTSVDIDEAPNIGKYDNWTHIQGDDTDPDVMAQVDNCDILFIDTSHHYEHTLWELRNWSPKVRPGGLIVCHDTELRRPWDPPCPATDPDFPVKSAIEVFTTERDLGWVNIPRCWGLGIIEVKG